MSQLLLAALMMMTAEPNLEQDYNRTLNSSPLAMVMVVARYTDGTPVRGTIQCTGEWWKHQDGDDHVALPAMPFATDSRGAAVLNPHISDEYLLCWANDRKGRKSGQVMVMFDAQHPTGTFEIVMDK